jgi:hypothetical protein
MMKAEIQILLTRVIVVAGKADTRVGIHPSELADSEWFSISAESGLNEERRPRSFDPDRRSGDENDGNRNDQQYRAEQEIECTLR